MTQRDKLLIIAIAVVSLAGLAAWYVFGSQGHSSTAVIKVLGKTVEVVDLNVKGTERMTIEGVKGPSVLEVKDGKVKMVSSPCPDKLCIKQGWTERPGQTVVCVPNGISVSISGDGGVDTIVR